MYEVRCQRDNPDFGVLCHSRQAFPEKHSAVAIRIDWVDREHSRIQHFE